MTWTEPRRNHNDGLLGCVILGVGLLIAETGLFASGFLVGWLVFG